ncbi:hypothetical protein FHG87_011375 [Trinorchestia longiramus]|nr:hypothetical protein FHG87_011375 [Trinorchestia longiramus]
MSGSIGCTSLRGKRLKEICEYAKKVINDMNEGMVIVQGGGNGLLENGSEVSMKEECGSGCHKCFLGDGVHLSQEGETKFSQIFIWWIRATHLMEGRMD